MIPGTENTTLIPFNFNQYDNASELIKICQKHEGNIQDSFALMLKTIKATDSSSFNEALQNASEERLQETKNAINYILDNASKVKEYLAI